MRCCEFGLGDTLSMVWCWHAMRVAGIRAMLSSPLWSQAAHLFGVPPEDICLQPLPPPELPFDFPAREEHEEWRRRNKMKLPKGLLTPRRGWVSTWTWIYSGQQLPIPPSLPFRKCPLEGEKTARMWEGASRGEKGRRALVFPSVTGRVRRWPLERFVELAKRLHDAGWSVLLLDRHVVPPVWGLAGLPIRTVIHLIEEADLVVGNDSGPAHVAGALGTPCVAVCGPSPRGILFEHAPSVREVHTPQLLCTGCGWRRENGYVPEVCQHSCLALNRTTVDEVFTACAG